jgi:hypothetical protein
VQTFPTLADLNLGVAYGIYARIAIVFVFVIAKVKETRGIELEQMWRRELPPSREEPAARSRRAGGGCQGREEAAAGVSFRFIGAPAT